MGVKKDEKTESTEYPQYGNCGSNDQEYCTSVKAGIKAMALTNAYRAKKGSHPNPQIWNKKVHDQCYKHAKDMRKWGRINHDGFMDRWNALTKEGLFIMK